MCYALQCLSEGKRRSPNCSARRDTRGTAISQKVQIPSSSPHFCSHDDSWLNSCQEDVKTQKAQLEPSNGAPDLTPHSGR